MPPHLPNTPADPPADRVPLRAAFTGLKGVPWLALAHSDIRARLVLHAAELEYRVVWRCRRRSYAEVAEVDLRTGWGTVNVVLAFRDGPFTFTANTGDRGTAARVLRRLEREGCPLSERARRFLAEAAPSRPG